MVSDFDVLKGPERFDAEFDLIEQVARAAGRPLSMTWLQRDPGGAQWKAIRERVDAAVAHGLPLYLQAAARGIGVIIGLDASFHPFMGFPGLQGDRAAAARRARRGDARSGAQGAASWPSSSDRVAGDGSAIPPLVDILLARIELISGRMFPLGADLDYEPTVMQSFLVRAKQRGCSALEALYDHLAEGDGTNLIYFPIFNYNDGSLGVVREHARASARAGRPERCRRACRHGLRCELHDLHADALGARPRRRPAAARARGRDDDAPQRALPRARRSRHASRPGQRADLNVIDPQRAQRRRRRAWSATCRPAAGASCRRASAIVGTWVAGQPVQRDGEPTGERARAGWCAAGR